MKKILLVHLLTIFCFNDLSSQTQKWGIGFLTGSGITSSSFSFITEKEPFILNSFPGISGGIKIERYFSNHFSLAINAMFDRKIWTPHIPLTDAMGQVTGFYKPNLRFDCVSVPVYGSWHFGGNTQLLINVGAYANYLISESFKNLNYFMPNKRVIIDHSKKWGGGALLGIGLTSALSNRTTFSLEFRNWFGLMNEEVDFNYHCLLAGFTFRFGKSTS